MSRDLEGFSLYCLRLIWSKVSADSRLCAVFPHNIDLLLIVVFAGKNDIFDARSIVDLKGRILDESLDSFVDGSFVKIGCLNLVFCI
jgi:hypothetical protein